MYLDIHMNTKATGLINISIDEDVQLQDNLLIKPCCVVNDIATIQDRPPFPVKNNSQFAISAIGKNLGRSTIKFIVYKNISKYNTAPDITDPNFLINTTDIWWMAYTYDVTVKNAPQSVKFYLSAVVLGLIALNLVGVGGQVDGDQVIRLLKKPLAVGVGMLCRFGILPAVSTRILMTSYTTVIYNMTVMQCLKYNRTYIT